MLNKLYSALYDDDCHPFNLLASGEPVVVQEPEELEDSNSALIIWGGSDINPSLYKHPQSRTTYPGGKRDFAEWNLLQAAIKKKIPIIGVCRGAQMLCAAAGGYLLQHVHGHGGTHICKGYNGSEFVTNSIHHQMMAGFDKVGHELLAWLDTPLSPKYLWKDDKLWNPPEGWKEPEFVHFTDIRGFAIQWHPEMMNGKSPATQFVLKEIDERVRKGM